MAGEAKHPAFAEAMAGEANHTAFAEAMAGEANQKNNKFMESRRKFLRNATGLIATGLVTNALTVKAQPIEKADASGFRNKEADPIYRTLGRTGIKLPIVSMGVMNSSNPNL